MTLGFAPRRIRIAGIVITAVTACFIALVGIAPHLVEAAFATCWIALLIVASSIYLRAPQPGALFIALATLAGIGAGAVIGAEADRLDLARALPMLLLVVPARWIVERGWSVALKVAGSWAIAIALLAALLPATPSTTGYQSDHMD